MPTACHSSKTLDITMRLGSFWLLAALLTSHALASGPYLGTHPVLGSTAPRIVQQDTKFKRIQIGNAQFSVPTDWQPKSDLVGVNFVNARGAQTNILVLNHANARPRIANPQVTIAQTLAHFCTAPFESRIDVVSSNRSRDISFGYCKETGQTESKPYFVFFEVRTSTHMLHLMRERISDLQDAKAELSAVAESAAFD